jgi:peroxiredoxin
MIPLARTVRTRSFRGFLLSGTFVLTSCAGGGLKAPEKSRPAPDYSFQSLDGGYIHLRECRGKVVLLNVWASWCGPCRVEMPDFEKVYQEYKEDDFVILGVARDDLTELDQVRRFLHETGVTYRIGFDPVTDFADFTGRPVQAIPTSFLIDKEGRIRLTMVGLFKEKTLRTALAPLLAEGSGG